MRGCESKKILKRVYRHYTRIDGYIDRNIYFRVISKRIKVSLKVISKIV
jgi:hypothetical protein